jgi:hypothetical protein
LRDQLARVVAAAGLFGGTSKGQKFIAFSAQILGHFFFQCLFDGPLGRSEDGAVDLLAEFTFDMAREPFAIDNLHVVIEVTAVVKLLSMAHRDILLSN